MAEVEEVEEEGDVGFSAVFVKLELIVGRLMALHNLHSVLIALTDAFNNNSRWTVGTGPRSGDLRSAK